MKQTKLGAGSAINSAPLRGRVDATQKFHHQLAMPQSVISSVHSEYVKEHNTHVMKPPKLTWRNTKKYIATRIPSLFVPKEELQRYSMREIFNPFWDLKHMTAKNWNYFLIGFAGWTWDAFDFFAVSINASSMAKSFDVSVKSVTWGITLVLMLRSVGALIFGYWGDRYGRKWPYIINLGLLVVLQIGTGFVKTYKQFLGVRAIFGVAMGGVYGFSLATALDDAPVACRGILSGIFQEGYAFGYLLVVIFNRAITDTSPHGWRGIFWFAAGPPVLFIIWRMMYPETDAFLAQKLKKEQHAQEDKERKFGLSKHAREALSRYWLVLIYCIPLMAGFNFMSHGSQDLYPTLLTAQLQYGNDRSTVTNCVANLGAIFGGIVCGHFSTFVGRRLTIIIACIVGGAMIYPWAYTKGSGINAGVFFLQAGVQGAWGVIPIHLSELSPPAYRSLVVGLSYQLGNLASSASSTIESTIGERFPITLPNGEEGYNYSKVMSIFIGAVFGFVILVTLIGPENRGADFDMDRDVVLTEEEDGMLYDDVDGDSWKENKPTTLHKEGSLDV